MLALCVARHPYLAEHIARYFGRLGFVTAWAVGVDDALRSASERPPTLVLCEYDLLAAQSLERWERHPTLAAVPLVAVSLTRRPTEVNLLDVGGIAGFLYLPTLRADDAVRVLGVAHPPAGYSLPSSFGAAQKPAATSRGW